MTKNQFQRGTKLFFPDGHGTVLDGPKKLYEVKIWFTDGSNAGIHYLSKKQIKKLQQESL